MLAGSASSADKYAFREDMLNPADHCTTLAYYPALSAVRYSREPVIRLVPVVDKPREFQHEFPVSKLTKALCTISQGSAAAARMLRASIIQSESGVRAKREYRCGAECGCSHFVPGNLTVSCPVKCNKQSPTIALTPRTIKFSPHSTNTENCSTYFGGDAERSCCLQSQGSLIFAAWANTKPGNTSCKHKSRLRSFTSHPFLGPKRNSKF